MLKRGGTAPVVAALGTAQTVAWGSSYYLPATLANPMAAELGLGSSTIFIAFSCGLLISAFLGPMAGRLIDLHGGHRVLPASNALFACGLSLLGLATSSTLLFAAWLVLGAAMSCGLYESAFATLARIYGRDARRAITGITLIAGFASTVSWPLTAWLEVRYGWRMACFVWAAAHVVICLPLNIRLPMGGHSVRTDMAPAPDSHQRANRWAMAGLAFVFMCTWFGSTSMAAHLPRLLESAGATPAAAVAAAALIGPAQVGARLMEFWLMRHTTPLTSARLAALSHPVGASVLLAAGAPAAPVFTIAHGGGNGVMTIANGTLPLYLFGAASYGLRQGLLMMPARFIQATSPFLFDLLLSRLGVAALAVTSALGLASFLVLCALNKR